MRHTTPFCYPFCKPAGTFYNASNDNPAKTRKIPQIIKIIKAFILLATTICMIFLLLGCGEKIAQNPLGSAFGKVHDKDPLKIGSKPTPPAKQAYPKLIVGKVHFAHEKGKDFGINSAKIPDDESYQSAAIPNVSLKGASLRGVVRANPSNLSNPSNTLNSPNPSKSLLLGSPPSSPTGDYFSLSSPAGAILTVWALAQGNWLWGYTLADSVGFGDARVWRFRFFKDNQVMLENAKTFTCANAYGTGVIHSACDETNMSQRFELIPMTNEAFLLRNVGNGRCLHAPISDVFGDFHRVSDIYLVTCTGGDNLDQQWYIIPPPFLVKPLYKR